MGNFPVIKSMEEEKKEEFPLWNGVFCPEWFESFKGDYPNPKIKVYYSSNKFGPDLSLGFSLEKTENWSRRGTLVDFLEAAFMRNWIVGENWGFPKKD